MLKTIDDSIKNIYFLGIGGIGMSALARYFKAKEYTVAGYDKTPSPLTDILQLKEGISINYADNETEINSDFHNPKTTLVVYTPAVPLDSKQMTFFRKEGFVLYKRAEVLGMISRQGKAICVAGTHGKTTVSTMTAFLLHHSAIGCNAFLGGISVNFETNLLLDNNSPYTVIEADEFDRSFLQLSPEIAVITSMDEDHLDIYENKGNITEAFESFAKKMQDGGRIFLKEGLSLVNTKATGTYGLDEAAACYSNNLRIDDGCYIFDYHGRGVEIKDLKSGVPGRLNVENLTAAITLALEAGVTAEEIKKSLPAYKGVVRRFNVHINDGQRIYIDDYAHHPREIEATLHSVKEMWPDKKIMVIFQPHLYTRTRDFYLGFAESLSLADQVVLLDIYPAREQPISGISSEIIREQLTVPGRIMRKGELLDKVVADFQEGILITMGAGDIDRIVHEIIEVLKR